MKSMGMKHFRLSISWSRVLPLGTTDTVNKQGVDFYHNVIDELLLNGLEPWVTLYHWDLPSTLFNKSSTGAWLSRDIIDPFVAYADFCFNEYGSKVRKWITFNEPQTFAWIGYGIGVHAPGRCSDYMGLPCRESGGGGDTPTEPYIVSHNVILAHAKTYRLYEKKYRDTQHGELGLCVASYVIQQRHDWIHWMQLRTFYQIKFDILWKLNNLKKMLRCKVPSGERGERKRVVSRQTVSAMLHSIGYSV